INALCNGMSLRACARMFNTHRIAIQNLLIRVGMNCDRLMMEHMRKIDCRNLELDELWTFCGEKQGRLRGDEGLNPDLGDQYVFFGIDHDTRVIPAWAVGKRTNETALVFLYRLKEALNGCRSQVSTDACGGYEDTIEQVFGADVDY